MAIPPQETILRRADARNYLFEKCPWYPCHKPLETCNLCYCPFYPCGDTGRGEMIISRSGAPVWSCMHCSWAHEAKTVDGLREFLRREGVRSLSPPDLYRAFMERLKREKE